MISGENASKRNKVIEWSDECEEAFRKLKEICTTTPILDYADFSGPFNLHADACTLGVGAILYQNQDGLTALYDMQADLPSKTEHKYPAHKLEFLALKLAVMEQFHEYLYGNHFVIYADYNNSLTYVLSSAKLDATGHCWVAGLANYNFALNYQSGKINVEVHAHFHIPKGEHDQHIEDDSVCSLISQVLQGATLTEAYSCNI